MKVMISKSGYDVTPLSPERVAQLAAKLDPEAYKVTQKAGTEAPFCGTLLDNHKDGAYACVVCGLPLFSSEHKFDSGTGWPSFYREFDPEHVSRKRDLAYGMVRTEINCARCGAHLGHVFDDGPRPSGERHCLNSASLVFFEKGQQMPARVPPRQDRDRLLRRRLLLGDRALLPAGAGGDRRRQRLHAGARRQPHLQAGVLHGHRPRRDRQGHVRRQPHQLPPAAAGVLRHARPYRARPSGAGRRFAVPLGYLDGRRRAAARGRGVRQGATGVGPLGRPERSSPRSSPRRCSGRPRTTTRTTSPPPGGRAT